MRCHSFRTQKLRGSNSLQVSGELEFGDDSAVAACLNFGSLALVSPFPKGRMVLAPRLVNSYGICNGMNIWVLEEDRKEAENNCGSLLSGRADTGKISWRHSQFLCCWALGKNSMDSVE